jgi:hypothetical protein
LRTYRKYKRSKGANIKINTIYILKVVLLLSLVSCAKIKKTLGLCDGFRKRCDKSLISIRSKRSSSHSSPTFSSSGSTNPSASTTRRGFGIETLYYKSSEFHVASGTGIVGASLSTKAPEDTFFGPVPIENRADFVERRRVTKEKYESEIQVINLGYKVIGDKRSKRKKGFSLTTGAMLRYHKKYKTMNYGGGISTSWRFLHGGISVYEDQFFDDKDSIDYDTGNGYETVDVANVKVQTLTTAMNAGVDFGRVMFDYTNISRSITAYDSISLTTYDINNYMINTPAGEVEIYSGSVLLFNFALTYGHRKESGFRPHFERSTSTFDINNRTQEDTFMGIQYQISSNIMLSMFSNYYLQDEYSYGITIFI